jgi:hypothetical protein
LVSGLDWYVNFVSLQDILEMVCIFRVYTSIPNIFYKAVNEDVSES